MREGVRTCGVRASYTARVPSRNPTASRLALRPDQSSAATPTGVGSSQSGAPGFLVLQRHIRPRCSGPKLCRPWPTASTCGSA